MTDPLVQCLLARDDDDAADAWRRWRSSTDIDSIRWVHALMVPMIREDLLQRLIAGDDAAPRLAGLARRAWTYGTTRTALARELAAQLTAAGISPVMIGGSVAAFMHRRTDGPIRPVTDIVLLVPRHHVHRAFDALRQLGWEGVGAPPPSKAHAWTTFVPMRHGHDTLRIAWRHVGTPPWRSHAAERALFARLGEALPLEALLLSRLSSGGAWHDAIPWQADVALLASHPIDWDVLINDAVRFAPDALARLRSVSIVIPSIPTMVPKAAVGPILERALWRGARLAILSARRLAGRR